MSNPYSADERFQYLKNTLIFDGISNDVLIEIEAKGKGAIKMYFLNRIKPEYTKDTNGILPNNSFLDVVNSIN